MSKSLISNKFKIVVVHEHRIIHEHHHRLSIVSFVPFIHLIMVLTGNIC